MLLGGLKGPVPGVPEQIDGEVILLTGLACGDGAPVREMLAAKANGERKR